ncbi:MFS general substrate transporter [Tirmania nivea]|nr:MFS general substrate transporter [Tirmania nivea]
MTNINETMSPQGREKSSIQESPASGSYNNVPVPSPGISESALLRKIDWHVIPMLFVLYVMAFLDRVNIGNAAVFGLKEDLNLGGVEYNVALMIFFIPYILCQIPSNLSLKKVRPKIWLSGCMFLFGMTTCIQGFVQNYHGLLVARFFLGVFESGVFPGCFYLIAMWYRRQEVQKRSSFFFNSTSIAGAFGSLLATAIGKMDGMRGYRGWRWVFILEGVLTMVIALTFFTLIADFPEQSTFLTEEEKEFVKARLRHDVGNSAIDEKVTLKDVLRALGDYRLFLGAVMYLGSIVPAYGYAYFAPTIINSYGYGAIETQLHSVPPWVVAFTFSMLIATFSDYIRHRFAFVLGSLAVAITGVIILLTVYDKERIHIQYFALFLVISGTNGAGPIIISWFTSNLSGHHRRSIGSAYQISLGNIAGIISSFTFVAADRPRYIPGYSILLAFMCFTGIMTTCYFWVVTNDNGRKDKGTYKYAKESEKWQALSEGEKVKMGDLAPDYRYLR